VADNRYLSVYGDRSGHWLLLAGPQGLISPPTVGASFDRTYELRPLGSPWELLVRLQNPHYKDPLVRAAMAELLGVTGTYIADCLEGIEQLDLDNDGWANLVRGHFNNEILDPILERARLEAGRD
jgi:hypothetical protein